MYKTEHLLRECDFLKPTFLSKRKTYPPGDREKVVNHDLAIHLQITSQNLIHEPKEMQKHMQLCESYRAERNRLNNATVGAKNFW